MVVSAIALIAMTITKITNKYNLNYIEYRKIDFGGRCDMMKFKYVLVRFHTPYDTKKVDSFEDADAPVINENVLYHFCGRFIANKWNKDYYIDGIPPKTQTVALRCNDSDERDFSVHFMLVDEENLISYKKFFDKPPQ